MQVFTVQQLCKGSRRITALIWQSQRVVPSRPRTRR